MLGGLHPSIYREKGIYILFLPWLGEMAEESVLLPMIRLFHRIFDLFFLSPHFTVFMNNSSRTGWLGLHLVKGKRRKGREKLEKKFVKSEAVGESNQFSIDLELRRAPLICK